MKKNLSLFFLIISLIDVQAQMPDMVIELKLDSTFKEFGFSAEKVIDKRAFKSNIGLVSRGMGANNTQIVLKDNSEEGLSLFVHKMLAKRENNPTVIVIIRSLVVSENIGTMTQLGYCNVEIEFAKQIDTLLYSLGTFYGNTSQKNNTVKYSHDKRIILALNECFIQFEQSNWKSKEGTLIENLDTAQRLNYKSIPPKGAYLNYDQLKRESPFYTKEFEIKVGIQNKKFVNHVIDFKGQINPERVQFFSDGKDVYMRASKTHFLKARSYGKYIYFQGRVPTNSSQTDINSEKQPTNNNTALIVGGSLVGITAALLTGTGFIVYGTSNNTNTTNMTIKGVVIDTETEELKFVTDLYLYKITKEFPSMLKDYRKSKRKLEDKKKVIIHLNTKF